MMIWNIKISFVGWESAVIIFICSMCIGWEIGKFIYWHFTSVIFTKEIDNYIQRVRLTRKDLRDEKLKWEEWLIKNGYQRKRR